MYEALGSLVACVFCIVPYGPVTDSVDVIEVNHFYDQQGEHIFDQLIFWDGLHDGRRQIRDWRLIKTRTQYPYIEHGQHRATWHDGLTLRQVRAIEFCETWTQYDPETVDRATLPQDQRKLLTVPKVKIER